MARQPVIGIIDYGMGNLRSVARAVERMGGRSRLIRAPKALARVDGLILPGVGAFGAGMTNLSRAGFPDALRAYVASGRPLLGICLGFQLFFEVSCEDGRHAGLGIIPGEVKKFRRTTSRMRIPHMGWNRLRFVRRGRLFRRVAEGAFVYFVHSYYCVPRDARVVTARAIYGRPFAAAIESGSVLGTQFHPEKSSVVGLRMLANFIAGVRG